MNLRVQREVHQAEGKLAAITRAFGGQPGFLELGENFGGNFLGRIAVIGGETVQHFFVPHPVLQHLRGRLDEIARHAGAGEARVFGARQDRVHGVAEFVEDRFDVVVRQERRLVLRRASGNCRSTRQSGR